MSVRYHNDQNPDVSEVMNNLTDAKRVLLAIIENTRNNSKSGVNLDQAESSNLGDYIKVKTSKGIMTLKQVG